MKNDHLTPEQIAIDSQSKSYVHKLLNMYLALPDTPNRASSSDRRLAADLFTNNVPIDVVEQAFVLATYRRTFRDPRSPLLQPIRSLHYFVPVIREILHTGMSPDHYRELRFRLANRAAAKKYQSSFSSTEQ